MDRRRLTLGAFALVMLSLLLADSWREVGSQAGGQATSQEREQRRVSPAPLRNPASSLPGVAKLESAQNGAPAYEQTSLVALRSELEAHEKCYESRRCALPNTDPRAYDLSVGTQIVAQLEKIRAFALANGLLGDPELESIALHALANPDGHVKAAALEILRLMPPSEAILAALLEHVIRAHDSELLSVTLGELNRYEDDASIAAIDKVFGEVLATGSHFVSLTLAQNIFPFLHPNNINFYRQVWQGLLPSHPVRKPLAQQIQVFLAQQNGG